MPGLCPLWLPKPATIILKMISAGLSLMMKSFIFLLASIYITTGVFAQDKQFIIQTISLPSEISYYNNQFSGLQVANNKLYLLSESRLEDSQETKLYSINLADIEKQFEDSNYKLPYEKIMIHGLNELADRMKNEGQAYEGLEAFIIKDKTVYLSVETNTPSPYCYLVKGKFKRNGIHLRLKMTKVLKPMKPNGGRIYNAGFEAITLIKKKVFAFYEYNYFDKNYVYCYNPSLKPRSRDSLPIDKLPFRITDITPTGNNHFTAINYFFKGGGGDTVYRVPSADKLNDSLIKKQDIYYNYARLVDIEFGNNHFSWTPLWALPEEYSDYNWEGIAAFKSGYFIMNDKFTPARPYSSVLLFLQSK